MSLLNPLHPVWVFFSAEGGPLILLVATIASCYGVAAQLDRRPRAMTPSRPQERAMIHLTADALLAAEYVHPIATEGTRTLALVVCPGYDRIMFRVTCGPRRFESNNIQLVLDRYHEWATHPPSAADVGHGG